MSSTATSHKKKGEHRILRFVVICMGLVLIGGTIFLFATIMHKASQSDAVTPDNTNVQDKENDVAGSRAPCGMVPLDFRGRGRIIALEIEATRVHAVTQPEGAPTAIITINRCSGEVISQQTIVADGAAASANTQTTPPTNEAE